jgi:class 3 adenylate cyclase
MPEQEYSSRTLICSIVFVDIVEYSKKPTSLQIEAKNLLNRLIKEVIVDVNQEDRMLLDSGNGTTQLSGLLVNLGRQHIVLDTGDGAALCFLGAPEEALFAANSILVSLLNVKSTEETALRIGINLGSVKLVRDIHGQRNIIGDGINTAQRVMSFAQPNQILVSRSYYDVVSNLSPEYAKLFRYLGVRQDKHVREHVVYEVTLGPRQSDQPSAAAQDITETGEDRPHPELVEIPVQQPITTPTTSLDDRWLTELERELTKDIGPIAKVIVRKCVKKIKAPSELIAAIERELGLEQGASDFRRRIKVPEKRIEEPQAMDRVDAVPTQSGSVSSTVWNEQQLRAIEIELSAYLGPVAGLLTRKMAKQCTTYVELCQALALHIQDETVRKRILTNLLKRQQEPTGVDVHPSISGN